MRILWLINRQGKRSVIFTVIEVNSLSIPSIHYRNLRQSLQ